MQTIKLVVVGDDGIGKTCLLITYTSGAFPTDYIPTVFDNYSPGVMVKPGPQLGLWDTAGNAEYDRLRPLSYPHTDFFLMCFSVSNPKSFDSITTKWVHELRMYCPSVPFMLVGLKTDSREDKNMLEILKSKNILPITEDEGKKVAEEMGAVCYMECSSLMNRNVKQIFDKALSVVLSPPKAKQKKCILV